MEVLSKSYLKKSGRSIPTVILNDCNDLELMINSWFGQEISSWRVIGLLMYKLQILNDKDSVVEIYNYDKESNTFCCIVDKVKIYEIKFNNVNVKGINPEIEVRLLNKKEVFECIDTIGVELGMIVQKRSQSVYRDGICYTRYLSRDNAKYVFDNGKYLLELDVYKPEDKVIPLFDELGYYDKYKLDNEDDLVKYMEGLEYPVSIIDIYKDICNITLLDDVSKYPRIILRVVEKNFNNEDKVINLIHLENGNLIEFGMQIVGTDRIVFIDRDGKWSYENNINDSLVRISSSDNYNNITYYIDAKYNVSLSKIKAMFEDNIDNAYKDIDNTKVLVKKLFKDKERW